MDKPNGMKEEIISKFNGLTWHDAKLIDFSFYRNSANENEIRMGLVFESTNGWSPLHWLTFEDSTFVNVDVDLEGKRVCSDSIASAACSEHSDWVISLSQASPYDDFSEYLHFKISLIPPGGSINILAKSFLLTEAHRGLPSGPG